MFPPRPFPQDRRSGFALLITITLLAFLVLLLVSLAALTRVETQVAANNQQLSQARQNALMAINIALGRLQSLAGPDQRITATADLITGVDNTKRRWTGVWNTTSATPVPEWLVSTATGVAPTGTTTSITTALVSTGTVTLVGSNTVDTSVAGNAIAVETQPITVAAVPGMSGPQTIGNFAYWVGDEGVKARVSLIDPWTNPSPATLNATSPATTTSQADAYRFINAQRIGIEGVDAGATGTQLSSNYPANTTGLPRILDLKQLPLSNPSAGAQTALSAAVKNRFHDLTATAYSVLSDVAKGGLKKDLTAWIADSAAPSNPVSANAADDYITPGDSTDTSKYGLPKWALIRSYAQTLNTGTPLTPRTQTATQQGVSPVMTYARMGYNLTMPDAATGAYRINVMPVVALWNPYNVPIQASNDSSNTYEFCVKYKPTVFVRPGGIVTFDGVRLRLVYTSTVTPANGTDSIHLGTVQIQSGMTGPLGPAGTFASYAVGGAPQISSVADANPVFWRFKLKLSRVLAPGESRLFTISDASDNSQYVAGQSELSDVVLGSNNGVYLPSMTSLNPSQTAVDARVFWNTEPTIGGTDFSITPDAAMMDFRLTKPVPAGTSNLTTIDAFLTNADNTYQAILGNSFTWRADTNPVMFPPEILPPQNNGRAMTYQRVELQMSSNYDRFVSGANSPGTPRWLAQLNPQAAVMLRKPSTPTSVNSPAEEATITPSYEKQFYIKREGVDPANYPYILIPDANGTQVSAGTQVATPSTPQNVVLREFQADATTLVSLSQLQHVNASLLNLNPAYPIGNSLANLYVPRTATQSALLTSDGYNTYHPNNTYPGFPDSGTFQHIYDLSYLLNKALWDGYFFSTIPSTLTGTQVGDTDYHLPNARHLFYSNTGTVTASQVTELKASSTAAAHLLVNGGFNVNSTSEQAWRALLYCHNGVATDPADSTGKTRHPYSRATVPVDSAQPNTTWPGYRILSDDQITALAKAIVAEIRTRGPSLSLADFVNRRLVANATGLKGPLQAAIDATTSGSGSINGRAPFNSTANAMSVSLYAPDVASDSEQKTIYAGGTYSSLPSTIPSASRAAFAPGYLTQADLLNAIGPSLTARSDTFRIRTYGDVVNPATGSATPEARAWCEAIVQRLPDYVDASLPAETDLSSAPASTARTVNQTFGRRFKIVSFRWLSSDDI
jgi:hypothetical protein